jgi:hypothetical protein
MTQPANAQEPSMEDILAPLRARTCDLGIGLRASRNVLITRARADLG